MMMMMKSLTPCLWLWQVLLLLLPTSTVMVHACGGLFCEPSRPVVQAGEAIAFGVDTATNRVSMTVQIVYEGPAEAFSWVLPVPMTPEVISVGSDVLFTALFRETLPTFELDIANNQSTTCTENDLLGDVCAMASFADRDVSEEAEAMVVEQGTTGPYDYVVLEAAENNPNSVLEWLSKNGYDQPEGAGELLNYYALLGQKFVAIKLTKNSEAGDIQPLTMEYQMETASTTTPIACVPIKLTAIAANDNMPVQIYVFADARAVPLNYLDVELDDSQVDWLGCLNNPTCYDGNYRARIQEAMAPLDNHGFVTEYAGASNVMQNKVELVDIDLDELNSAETWIDYLTLMANAGVPAVPIVDSIINKYIPNTFEEGPFCAVIFMPDQIFNMGNCFLNYEMPSDDWTFDNEAMTEELNTKVFLPAKEAQAFVDTFSYMTRMYGVLGPETMDKDPFFTLKPDAPDVSNVHSATAVPVCVTGEGPIALEVSVPGMASITIPARPECSVWSPIEDDTIIAAPGSTAIQLTSWGFADQTARVLSRSSEGAFSKAEILDVVAIADTLVVDQTVPAYVTADDVTEAPSDGNAGSGSTTTAPDTLPPTSADTPDESSARTLTWSSGTTALAILSMATAAISQIL